MDCGMQQTFIHLSVYFCPAFCIYFVVFYWTSRLEQGGLLQIEDIAMCIKPQKS